MKADRRGRVRFGYRLNYGGGDYESLRIEVSSNGKVNITTRDQHWGEEGAPSSVYRDLMGDRDFIQKLSLAQRVAAQHGIARKLFAGVPSYEVAAR